MDYSNLFLNKESIENVLKISQKPTKGIGRGLASLVKSGAEKDAVQECNQCDYKTAIYNYMYEHNRRKHSDIKHKCTECDYTHAYPSKVRIHHKHVHLGISRRHGIQLVCRKDICINVGKSDCSELSHFRNFCDQCAFSCRNNYDLKSHIKIMHEGFVESFPCDECDFSTDFRDSLRKHTMRVHEGEIEIFSCNQCDFSSNFRTNLKRHASTKHIGEAMTRRNKVVEECDFLNCTYKSLFKSELRTHIKTKHEGIVRFRCEFMNCTYGAYDRRSLKEHTITHRQEKISKCPICEKTFPISRRRDRHIRYVHEGFAHNLKSQTMKHTGEKAPKCTLCNKTFATQSSQTRHIKRFHGGI